MPEVYITELETALLSVFVQNKITDNDTVIGTLSDLIEKLKIARVD